MSSALDAVVPPALAELLAAEPSAESTAILVLTIREDGFPHQAMVSVGELAALDDKRLALALWPESTTTANLKRTNALTLAVVIGATSYTVRATTSQREGVGALARFDLTVVGVSADEAPYATLTSGVRFRLNDPDAVLARWREVREALTG
jgi:hypothetical protein